MGFIVDTSNSTYNFDGWELSHMINNCDGSRRSSIQVSKSGLGANVIGGQSEDSLSLYVITEALPSQL